MRNDAKVGTCEKIMEMRICTKCNKELPIERFQIKRGKNFSKSSEIHFTQCKSCTAVRRKLRYNSEEGFAERVLKNEKNSYHRTRTKTLQKYGGKCACCEESTFEFLSFDHIDGRADDCKRSAGYSGKRLLQWIIKNNYPADIQILCYNCNCAKGFYGECPHKQSQDVDRNTQQKTYKDSFYEDLFL